MDNLTPLLGVYKGARERDTVSGIVATLLELFPVDNIEILDLLEQQFILKCRELITNSFPESVENIQESQENKTISQYLSKKCTIKFILDTDIINWNNYANEVIMSNDHNDSLKV